MLLRAVPRSKIILLLDG
jgi:hypothetical protein